MISANVQQQRDDSERNRGSCSRTIRCGTISANCEWSSFSAPRRIAWRQCDELTSRTGWRTTRTSPLSTFASPTRTLGRRHSPYRFRSPLPIWNAPSIRGNLDRFLLCSVAVVVSSLNDDGVVVVAAAVAVAELVVGKEVGLCWMVRTCKPCEKSRRRNRMIRS